jgi:hypothetical protein
MAMAYWRVGEFSEDLKGHHDDSAPGAVIITETRLETAKRILFCDNEYQD